MTQAAPRAEPRAEPGDARIPAPRRPWTPLSVALVVAVAYGLGSGCAWLLFRASDAGAVFFPPAGVTLGALLLAPRRHWLWVLAAAGASEFAIDVWQGVAPPRAGGFVVTNVVEPLVAAMLIRRFLPGDIDLTRRRDAGVFLACGVGVGPLVGGAIGATAAVWGAGAGWWERLGQFWAGDGLAVLTLGAAVVGLRSLRDGVRPDRAWRLAAVLAATAALTVIGFWPVGVPLAYLPVPVLLVAGFRGRVATVGAAGFVMAFAANLLSAAGRGPWAPLADQPRLESATLQGYLAVVVLGAWILAIAVAERDRAVERAELYEAEHELAHQLQRSLLPRISADLPGVAAGVSYRPAERGHEVGGDWYDVFELPGNRVGIAVGDVVGHGMAAAVAMSRLQQSLRSVALTGASPAEVLEALDNACRTIDGADFATVGYAEYSPMDRTLTHACAGHLPPLLVVDGEARYLDGARSQPLRLPTRARPQAQVTVPVGAMLVWFSDGLVERRGEIIDVGLERLAAAAAALPTAAGPAAVGAPGTAEEPPRCAPQDWCDRLLAAVTAGRTVCDDAVVVCARLGDAPSGVDPSAVLRQTLFSADDLAATRKELRVWSGLQRLAEDRADDLLVACNEALINAIEHAYHGREPGPVALKVIRVDARQVRVEVTDRGRWRAGAGDAGDRGRGLKLIKQMARRMVLDISDDGTRVTITLPVD